MVGGGGQGCAAEVGLGLALGCLFAVDVDLQLPVLHPQAELVPLPRLQLPGNMEEDRGRAAHEGAELDVLQDAVVLKEVAVVPVGLGEDHAHVAVHGGAHLGDLQVEAEVKGLPVHVEDHGLGGTAGVIHLQHLVAVLGGDGAAAVVEGGGVLGLKILGVAVGIGDGASLLPLGLDRGVVDKKLARLGQLHAQLQIRGGGEGEGDLVLRLISPPLGQAHQILPADSVTDEEDAAARSEVGVQGKGMGAHVQAQALVEGARALDMTLVVAADIHGVHGGAVAYGVGPVGQPRDPALLAVLALEVAVDELVMGGDAAVGDDIGGGDALQGGGGLVDVIVDADAHHGGEVVGFGVVEGLPAVVGVIGPGAHGGGTRQETVVDLDIADLLLGEVGGVGAPGDEGNAVSAEDVAGLDGDVHDAVILAGGGVPPGHAAGVVVGGGEGHGIVIGADDEAVYEDVLGTAQTNAISRGAGGLLLDDIAHVDVAAPCHAHKVAVGAQDGDIRHLHSVTAVEGHGDNVDTALTARPDGGAVVAVQILTPRVVHADGTATRHLDVLLLGGQDEGVVMAEEDMGPVDPGDGHIVAPQKVVVIVGLTGGLPQDGPLLDAQLHVVLELEAGGNVASAVAGIVALQHHGTAALGVDVVDGGLYGGVIVGKAVALGTEPGVGDLDRQLGEGELVGVIREVAVVLHHEAVGDLDLPRGGGDGGNEQGGKAGDLIGLEGEGHRKVGAISLGGGRGGQSLQTLAPVVDLDLVELHRGILVDGVQLTLDGNGVLLAISQTGEDLTRVVVEGGLPLEGDGVDGDGTLGGSHGDDAEAAEVARGVLAGREVGVDRLKAASLPHRDGDAVVLAVAQDAVGLVVDLEGIGVGVVLHAEENGVLHRQLGAVGGAHGSLDGGGVQVGARATDGVDQLAVGVLHAPREGGEDLHRGGGGELQVAVLHGSQILGGHVIKGQPAQGGLGVGDGHRPAARGQHVSVGVLGYQHGLTVGQHPHLPVVEGDPQIPSAPLGQGKGGRGLGGLLAVQGAVQGQGPRGVAVLHRVGSAALCRIGYRQSGGVPQARQLGVQIQGIQAHRLLGGQGLAPREDVAAALGLALPAIGIPLGEGTREAVVHGHVLDMGGGVVALQGPRASRELFAVGVLDGEDEIVPDVPADVVLLQGDGKAVPRFVFEVDALGRADVLISAVDEAAHPRHLVHGVVLKEDLVVLHRVIGGTHVAVHGAPDAVHPDVEFQIGGGHGGLGGHLTEGAATAHKDSLAADGLGGEAAQLPLRKGVGGSCGGHGVDTAPRDGSCQQRPRQHEGQGLFQHTKGSHRGSSLVDGMGRTGCGVLRFHCIIFFPKMQ